MISSSPTIVTNAVEKALAHSACILKGEKVALRRNVSFELQNLAKSLAELIGHIDTEDVLDVVFLSFASAAVPNDPYS